MADIFLQNFFLFSNHLNETFTIIIYTVIISFSVAAFIFYDESLH